ncbi:MAG: chemotaxis protein CheW [Planctomycetota bacterium]
MQTDLNARVADDAVHEACWVRIGVQGDRSCPRLPQVIHCHNCPVHAEAGRRLFDREASPGYLEECTRQIAESETSTTAATLPLLVFRIGPEWLALDARVIVEVVELRTIHRVPNRTDRLLLGIANIRGELELCISLRDLLGIDSATTDATAGKESTAESTERLVVVEQDQDRWVFPVDEVEGVHHIPVSAMENLPHTVEKSPRFYSEAILTHAKKRVGVLSTTRLFPALERTVR